VRFGERRDTSSADEDLAALRFAASLSIVFVYLLMGFLFESFILPLSIIATIPLAGIGVAWIHYALGYNLDFLGVVGIVLLIGVVVNNGIVLIDYANRLRAEGMERAEALLVAAERRFSPIMMTALTTIIVGSFSSASRSAPPRPSPSTSGDDRADLVIRRAGLPGAGMDCAGP
jgi:HAE1 family hydrophobic/amphiphilic exporter-1